MRERKCERECKEHNKPMALAMLYKHLHSRTHPSYYHICTCSFPSRSGCFESHVRCTRRSIRAQAYELRIYLCIYIEAQSDSRCVISSNGFFCCRRRHILHHSHTYDVILLKLNVLFEIIFVSDDSISSTHLISFLNKH